MSKYKFVTKKDESFEETAVRYFSTISTILIICGIVFLAITWFISMLPQDYEKYVMYILKNQMKL